MVSAEELRMQASYSWTFPRTPETALTGTPRCERTRQVQLCYAAADNDIEAMKELIEEGADPNLRDYDARSPLHIAASHGNFEAVRVLLDRKADPNAADYMGTTPLDEARKRGRQDIVKALQANGATISQVGLRSAAFRDNWAVGEEDVKLGQLLSETLKSQVYRAEWMGTKVVAKFAKVGAQEGNKDKEAIKSELLHEIELLACLRHPDLVLFLGASIEDPRVMFISEYMEGGDLHRYYMRRRRELGRPFVPSQNQVARWGSAVGRALSFLHGCHIKIIHRDLKPLNLLMSRDCKDVKVTDFGISKMTRAPGRSKSPARNGNAKVNDQVTMTGGMGSLRYMAPEVVRYQEYDEKVDIYSFGLILFFMSSGKEPFHEKPQEDWMLQEYLHGCEPRPRPQECHKDLRDLMTSAWHEDARKRPSAEDLVESLSELPGECNKCALGFLRSPFKRSL